MTIRRYLSHLNGVLGSVMLLDGVAELRGALGLGYCFIGAVLMMWSLKRLH